MKLDDVKKLHQKKYRNQLGFYLVEGEHLILELEKAAQNQPNLAQTKLYVTEKYQDWSGPFEKQVVTDKQMEKLSDTKTPQGILACVPLPKSEESFDKLTAQDDPSTDSATHLLRTNGEKNDPSTDARVPNTFASKKGHSELAAQGERAIYLYEVQDPGNLGTILRTLAWFGNFRLLLSPNSVDPFNPKVVRSSMGAIFHVPMELDVTLESLQNRFNGFAYLDMNGEPVNSNGFANFDCYLFGNEARGVPREALATLNATAFTIPGNGTIESLNLASAVNMCAYQLSVVPPA